MTRAGFSILIVVFLLCACCASPANESYVISDPLPQLREAKIEYSKARIYALSVLERESCQGFFKIFMENPLYDAREGFLQIEFSLEVTPWYFTEITPEGVPLPVTGLHICQAEMDRVAQLDPFWLVSSSPKKSAITMIHEFAHILACDTHSAKGPDNSESIAQLATLACFGTR